MKRPSGKKARQKSAPSTPLETGQYVLNLYVTGLTPSSSRAIANAKAICEKHLKGRYELQIIDIYQRPALAKGEQIIAAPTLVKQLPLPLRRLVGDLSQEERVLMGFDLCPRQDWKAGGAARPGRAVKKR